MASPTLNFTDPVGVMQMTGEAIRSAYENSSFSETGAFPAHKLIAMPMTTYGVHLTLLGKQSLLDMNDTYVSELPPPPMGRMVLLTFPPIYKAQNEDSGPHTPRAFPPIYLLKLWGSN